MRQPQGCPERLQAESLVHRETQELTSIWAQVKTGATPAQRASSQQTETQGPRQTLATPGQRLWREQRTYPMAFVYPLSSRTRM